MKRALIMCITLAGAPILDGCDASAQQIQQTATDSFKLAGCILGEVLGGITDAGAIAGVCVGALPAVIVDVIDDFEAKPAAAQLAIIGAPLTSAQQSLLDAAKASAVTAIAQKAGGK